MKRRNHKTLIAAAAGLLFFAVAVACVLWYGNNKKVLFHNRVDVYVYPTTTVDDVLSQIKSGDSDFTGEGILRRVMHFEKLDRAQLFPGHYVAQEGMSAKAFAKQLQRGNQTPVKLVVSGTPRTKGQLAKKISSQLQIDSTSLHDAFCDDSFLSQYGFDSQTVFALFIPDTYEVYWNISLQGLFARMRKEYDAFWNEERLEKAQKLKLTAVEVATLASIVDQESNVAGEYPQIASVYLTRLRKRMHLSACPTINFCYDYTLTRVLTKHTKVDSPYNTYTHYGLPPGPICVPSKNAMNAVLNPANTSYLYFCASPELNGTHRFARTYREHRRNANEYYRALEQYRKNHQ